MKTWPILMVCQATGAVHTKLMHNYGASAFLLQWNWFTALRGDPSLAVSDCGSQLTSGKNNIAFPKRKRLEIGIGMRSTPLEHDVERDGSLSHLEHNLETGWPRDGLRS